MTVYLNKDYEIYDSDGDASLKVSFSDDQVRINVHPDEKSKEWFGDIDYMFTLDVAEKLAEAINLVVRDQKGSS